MKKVTAEIIETNSFLVSLEVEDDYTEEYIYNAVVDACRGKDCKAIEQNIDITNIKVEEK